MPDAENDNLPRNKLTFWDKINIVLTMLPIPVYMVWSLIKSPFSPYGRAKSWKRIIVDRAVYATVVGMNRRQLRAVFGPTSKTYSAFMKQNKLLEVVEEIGEDSRLLWLGPKHTDRVLLYFHGGGYLFGALDADPVFWYWIRNQLEKQGKPVGVAVLNYTLIPDRTFPTQLKQAILAVKHVIASGVNPSNIQLVGDSAGGLLIHQLFSHMLHPVDGVQPLDLDTPFAGAFMMSLWTRLRDPNKKYLQAVDGQGDFVSASGLHYWGSTVMEGVPESAVPYLEANEAPKSWLKDVHKCSKRILITAGGVEVLRDEIIKYAKTVEKYHKGTTTIIQENGVHIDPIVDFLVGDKEGRLAADILNWLDESFSA